MHRSLLQGKCFATRQVTKKQKKRRDKDRFIFIAWVKTHQLRIIYLPACLCFLAPSQVLGEDTVMLPAGNIALAVWQRLPLNKPGTLSDLTAVALTMMYIIPTYYI